MFQHYINNVLYNTLNNYIIIYIDNVLILSGNQAKYNQYIEKVSNRIIGIRQYVNINKFVFNIIKIKYLLIIKLGNHLINIKLEIIL